MKKVVSPEEDEQVKEITAPSQNGGTALAWKVTREECHNDMHVVLPAQSQERVCYKLK